MSVTFVAIPAVFVAIFVTFVAISVLLVAMSVTFVAMSVLLVAMSVTFVAIPAALVLPCVVCNPAKSTPTVPLPSVTETVVPVSAIPVLYDVLS